MPLDTTSLSVTQFHFSVLPHRKTLFKKQFFSLLNSSLSISSVVTFSSCLQSSLASGSFLRSQLLTSVGHSIGASASASVLSMNIQDWFPLGWTSWISLQCKRLSRVFSNITVGKHQFFGAQLSLWSNSHIHTWLRKTIDLTIRTCVGKVISA